MTLYVLDSDHLTLLDRRHPSVTERVFAADDNPSDELFTTVVSLEEQMRGRLAQVRKFATNPRSLVLAYKNLARTFALFDGLNVLDYSANADDRFREFRRAGIRIGTQDLRIASIALSSGGVLVTRNRRDFEKVPGLSFQDWSIEL